MSSHLIPALAPAQRKRIAKKIADTLFCGGATRLQLMQILGLSSSSERTRRIALFTASLHHPPT